MTGWATAPSSEDLNRHRRHWKEHAVPDAVNRRPLAAETWIKSQGLMVEERLLSQ